jgi:hypothetical protein
LLDKVEEEARRRLAEKKERNIQANARSAMLLKYFSEKINPAIHDKAAKTEVLSVWKDQFNHNKSGS